MPGASRAGDEARRERARTPKAAEGERHGWREKRTDMDARAGASHRGWLLEWKMGAIK